MHTRTGSLNTWKCAIYLRLSREDEDISNRGKKNSNSIENQKDYMKAFLKGRAEMEEVRYFIDDGYSGVNFDRPAFQKMMAEINAGSLNCIIVKDLSRLGRNYIETGKYIEQIFPALGIRFISINDNIDSMDKAAAVNDIIVPFKNLLNDAYCRDISIKIRSHLDIKRKNGEFTGAFPVYGYCKVKGGKQLQTDPAAAEIVKEIFQMKIAGMSQNAIANQLNEWGISSPAQYKMEQGSGYKSAFQTHATASWSAVTLNRILSNEVYTGCLIQGKETTPNYKIKTRYKKPEKEWIRIENAHAAIIAPTDFELVQELMKRDTRMKNGRNEISLYSGYLFCADCGCSMVRKTVPEGEEKYIYYICSGNKKDKNFCRSHRIPEKDLNDAVMKTIQIHIRYLPDWKNAGTHLKHVPEREKNAAAIDRLVQDHKLNINKYNRLKLESYKDMKEGILTNQEFILFQSEMDKRCMDMQNAITGLEHKRAILLECKQEKIMRMDQFLIHGNIPEMTRSLIVRLIDRIYIFEKCRIEIVFRYQDTWVNNL